MMPRRRSAGKRPPSRCSAATPSALSGTARFRTAARVSSALSSRWPGPSTSRVDAGSAPAPSPPIDAKLRLACERHRHAVTEDPASRAPGSVGLSFLHA